MKKHTLLAKTVLATSMLAAFGVASAGSMVGTSRNVAREAFGSAVTSASDVVAPLFGYQFSTPGGIVINPGGSIIVLVTPTGATFDSGATLPAACMNANIGGSPTITPSVSGGNLVLTVANAATATANSVIGVGAVAYVGSTGAGTNCGVETGTRAAFNNALGLASGTSITAVGSAGTSTGTPTNLEGTSASGTLVTSSQALTITLTDSATFGELQKIDLTTVNPGSTLTTAALTAAASLANMGKVEIADSGTIANDRMLTAGQTGTETPVNHSNGFTGAFSLTLTPYSGSFTAGTSFALNAATGCGGATTATTSSPTAISGGTTSVTLTTGTTALAAASNTFYICETFATTPPITAYRLAGAATAPGSSTGYTGDSASTTPLYDLQNNGAMVDIPDYVPNADSGSGYTSYVRIINTGSNAAAVTVSVIDQTSGVASVYGTTSTIASGGVLVLSASQLEALGTPGASLASGQRPRLRFTGPTGKLRVQYFLMQPGNSFNELDGGVTDSTGH